MIWQTVFIVLFAAPLALLNWQTPNLEQAGWFLISGLLGTAGHLIMQRGYRIAEISALQPVGFLSLIWNTIFGLWLFGQSPSIWTFVGATVIFASAMYISHREAVRRSAVQSGYAAQPKP